MNKIRIATIGTSSICEQFIGGLSINNRFIHEAVFSRDTQRGNEFAQKFGVKKVYTDLPDLCADSEIDAVYIASVNSCHYEQSKLMLEAGKHVICEKPLVTEPSQFSILKQLADEKNIIYMEAITSFYSPFKEKLSSVIKKIGDISLIRIDFCQRSSKLDRYSVGEHINVFDPKLGGGVLNDLGVYCIYAFLEFFPLPESIKATASYFKTGADKSGAVIFSFNDVTAVLSYSKTGQSFSHSEIIGQKGTIRIGSVSELSHITLIKGNKEIEIAPKINKEKLMSYESENFADFIENKNIEKYNEASRLCKSVHSIMQEIRDLI